MPAPTPRTPTTACPTCIADAPVEVAWSLLDPTRLDEWWDARFRRATPGGPLAPGQRIEGVTGPLGVFPFTWDILAVDPVAHRLRIAMRLPLGIVNDETVVMTALGPERCRIGFG